MNSKENNTDQQKSSQQAERVSRSLLERSPLARRLVQLIVVLTIVFAFSWSRIQSMWVTDTVTDLISTERFAEAETKINAFLSSHPDDEQVLFAALRMARAQGDSQQATDLLRKLKEVGADESMLEDESILLQARSGNLRYAERHLPRLLTESNRDTQDVCESYVIGYRLNFRFDEAAALLDAWQKDWPDDFRPMAHRGTMAQMVGKWKMAISEFQDAFSKGDWRDETYVKLGQCHLELNEFKLAEKQFRAALQVDADEIDELLGLAVSLEKQGLAAEALEKYMAALEVDPNSFDASLAVARLKLADGQAAESRIILEQLLAKWPEDQKALYQYSQALISLGEEAKSRQVLETWYRVDQEVQRMEKMVNDLATRPDDIEMRTEIGILLLKHYSRSMGVQYLQSVLILAPHDERVHEKLAEYYQKTGQESQAQQHLEFVSSNSVNVHE